MSVRRWGAAGVLLVLGCNEGGSSTPLGDDLGKEGAPVEHVLRVTPVGPGRGFVRSSPEGIRCAPECEADFGDGVSVELVAEPAPGSTFLGWGGECAGATPTCVLEMRGPRVASAQFFADYRDAGLPTDAGVAFDGSALDAGDAGLEDAADAGLEDADAALVD